MRHRLTPLFAVTLALPACSAVEHRLYPAPTEPLAHAALPAGARLVSVQTADRLSIVGVEMPGRANRPVLLVFHGNRSSAATTLAWFAPLARAGYGIVAAEYRGYSANPGRPGEAGLAADADAFYREAQRLAAGRPVIVIGHSLGGGVAFGLAMRQRLTALVTIGTFSRLSAMTPWVARPFVADRYDNSADVARLDEPLFVVHGTADHTVPPAEAAALIAEARAAGRNGGWFRIDGADHHPDAAALTAIVEAVDTRVDHPERVIPTLPPAIQFGTFAQ